MAVRTLDAQPTAPPTAHRLESVDFDMHESEQYKEYAMFCSRNHMGKWKGAYRWLYLAVAGIGAGGAAVFIQTTLTWVMDFKFWSQKILAEQDIMVRYGAWVSISLALAAVAGFLVCYIEPCAAGSGIPEIKSYLNGINQPNVLNPKTMVAKAVGIVASVAAGLPCGKEGPMIHSGAIVGAQMAKANAGPMTGPFRVASESRDFVAAGAAAGVAAAFSAPIGGVLFAVEEGATHMNPVILVRTFVCASFGALTVRFFSGPWEHKLPVGVLGTETPTEFGRFFGERRYFIWELIIFSAIGIVGGLLGAFANAANTRLTQWRARHIGGRGLKRYIEVFVVTGCIISFNFFAATWCQECESDMEKFTSAQRLFVDSGPGFKTLLHSDETVHTTMLAFFAVIHYLQLIWTYGLGVPSGLFVPALLGGASFGRLLGQAIQGSTWIAGTPGIYALVGAAALLTGMGRITISLSIILMECTGEAEWGLPIFLATLFAKWAGDYFNQGIYDIHIELKHVPLLELKTRTDMILEQATDMMVPQVVCMDSVMSIGALVQLLGSCDHNGFPVIEAETKKFIGTIERSTLHHLLHLGGRKGVFVESSQTTPQAKCVKLLDYEDLLQHFHPAHYPSLDAVKGCLLERDYLKVIDICPYTNMSAFTVPEHFSATRCYRLFREMGLRHLPVLGDDGRVSGIITRKCLVEAQEGRTKPGRAQLADTSGRQLSAVLLGADSPSRKYSGQAAGNTWTA